jgi:hypothetical protein
MLFVALTLSLSLHQRTNGIAASVGNFIVKRIALTNNRRMEQCCDGDGFAPIGRFQCHNSVVRHTLHA